MGVAHDILPVIMFSGACAWPTSAIKVAETERNGFALQGRSVRFAKHAAA
jgi:hypothetical protein